MLEPPNLSSLELDVAIIGAGPVGLALAIELSRAGFSTLVVDRRPPLDEDTIRPQLLVARLGDLANLDSLGIDVHDETLISPLATRCEGDLASGQTIRGEVAVPALPTRSSDLLLLARQPPLALVPIGALQQALLAQARKQGVTVFYNCEVTRLRRHARMVSLACSDGTTARAAIAIVATGAARSLIEPTRLVGGFVPQRMIGGVFAGGSDRGRWIRVELPVPGFRDPTRCTVLQTPEQSAILVDTQVAGVTTDEQLHHCFDVAARVHGLAGVPYRVEPQAFTTAITEVANRYVAGDGRAPVVIAGDAAQTGHVFSGQTCFINMALAIRLGDLLRGSRAAIVDRKPTAPRLLDALARYDAQSKTGASLLARASRRHIERHAAGAWALAGVARA
jgi:2-polyprenyl-6-methoxyphenol hydroxylase-like FAD-dependent oxidoreductase